MRHPRLDRLPWFELPGGLRVVVADSRRARLLGLAALALAEMPAATALLLPRCRSVHTFGMRFPLDVVFVDGEGGVLRVVLRVVLDVPPGRVVACRAARAVVEAPAGTGARVADGLAAAAGRGARVLDGR